MCSATRDRRFVRRAPFSTLTLIAVYLALGIGRVEAQTIGFVQVNFSAPQSTQAVVTVPYTAAQTVANLNVVVVGWSDSTAHVQSVGDSAGNAYVLAIGPTVQ